MYRKLNKIKAKKVVNFFEACQVISYNGYINSRNCWLYYNDKMKRVVKLKVCRKLVSKHYKKEGII